MEKRSYGGILICMVIRIILGALIGILTGISAANPFMGNAGIMMMIAGFFCIPTAVLFFMRKPVFPLLFFIMIILNFIGGLVLANNPFMQIAAMFMPIQTIMLVLVLIMDILFVVYLIRSVRVSQVFGANLFKSSLPAFQQVKTQAAQFTQNAANHMRQNMQQNHTENVANGNAEQINEDYKRKYEQMQRQMEQMNRQYAQPGYAPPQQYAGVKKSKTGLIIGLCAIAAAVVIVILIVMNLNSPMNQLMSFSNSLMGGSSSTSQEDGLFSQLMGSNKDEAEALGVREYLVEEVDRDVLDVLLERLNESGYDYELYGINVFTDKDNIVITLGVDLPERILLSDEKLLAAANELTQHKDLNAVRKDIASVLSADAKNKTGKNVKVIFEFFAPDNTRIAVG